MHQGLKALTDGNSKDVFFQYAKHQDDKNHSLGFAGKDAWKKRNNIIPNGDLMVTFHGSK